MSLKAFASFAACCIALCPVACGSRTGVPEPIAVAAIDAGPEAIPPDRCALISCDDGDPCTNDTCNEGLCAHAPSTPDVDGDGHRAPLPGFVAGAPGSCGDDCNDSSPQAFPGNKEVCDGIDNDCNGIVDDGARYVPADASGAKPLVQISDTTTAPNEPESIVWSGASYLATYDGTPNHQLREYKTRLAADGASIDPPAELNDIAADSVGATLAWTGAEIGVAWNDRRDDWAIWFSRLDPKGTKLLADEKVSEDTGEWAIDQSIAWTGTEYVIAWSDGRDAFPSFFPYAQRLDATGAKIGGNVKLSQTEGEQPVTAIGTSTIAVAWTHTDDVTTNHSVVFGLYDRTLAPIGTPQTLTSLGAVGVHLVWNHDAYVVAWYDQDESPHAIYGAVIDETGKAVVAPKQVTDSPRFSRYPSLLPLGDRVLLVWSDTKDQNDGYELYTKLLDRTLAPLGGETRITFAAGDSVFPVATFGPSGDVGIILRDQNGTDVNVLFARLICQAGN